ncbi:TetR/AcrR family transcriptional regulator [Streptomyces sp. MK5]|uniref:TetR/AcrR family transcriptional regulator n=1 Tax=Streptomyces sp. MK5 TaxID=3064253 RepID=UPI002740B475|nr:TetR/AcrR family transcriptional regulator [Streptomyces sp. MK5]
MPIQTRRERERAERRQLIVTALREPAEAEGWDAVTTRRPAATIEYSQPVLYSHFKSKDAIMAAVGEARTAFARRRPALYDAMFTLTVDLPFATPEAPAPLQEAFGEPARAVEPVVAEGDDPGLLTETYWATPHGLVTLMRGGRLPQEAHERRFALLIGHVVPPGTA